ncbi:MAG TPA: ethanolamine utilization protein EutJ [Sporichthyaceae bacterium]|nr:ethanolamine utilization protein EutJ [Sporichthyaceae bacterium]
MRTGIDVDRFLSDASHRLRAPLPDYHGDLRVGIDLGTATIVLTVVDALDRPVFLDFRREAAVRDGVVVDFHAATDATAALKGSAEAALGVRLTEAAAAYPPGVPEADARACRFVVERAGFVCVGLTDEVTAAQALLRLRDGAIADVGGGSTGVGMYRDGELVSLDDLPGGGHHLNLILAGAKKISVEEAEELKRTNTNDFLSVLRPGIERVAHNIDRLLPTRPDGPIHLVGGALMVPGAGAVVAKYLGHDVVEYPHALLITPFGIALSIADATSGALY